jgi:hypothetical protein
MLIFWRTFPATKACRFRVPVLLMSRYFVPRPYREYSEFGGGEREPCLQHVYGATHTDHGEQAQYLRA